jgi:hypothetical protein
MEAEKSCHLLSANLRNSKASGEMLSEFEGLRIEGSLLSVPESKGPRTKDLQCPLAEECDCPRSNTEKENLPFLYFVLFGYSMDRISLLILERMNLDSVY